MKSLNVQFFPSNTTSHLPLLAFCLCLQIPARISPPEKSSSWTFSEHHTVQQIAQFVCLLLFVEPTETLPLVLWLLLFCSTRCRSNNLQTPAHSGWCCLYIAQLYCDKTIWVLLSIHLTDWKTEATFFPFCIPSFVRVSLVCVNLLLWLSLLQDEPSSALLWQRRRAACWASPPALRQTDPL